METSMESVKKRLSDAAHGWPKSQEQFQRQGFHRSG